MSDEVRSLATGGELDFASFYDREYQLTLRVVYALCGSWSVSEEVTQDAFIKAMRRWNAVVEMRSPGAWVRRVACNAATSRFRRLAAEARALARLGSRAQVAEEHATSGSGEDFWRLVRRLPRRQAQVVALFYADDLAVSDIAEVLALAEGTVKAHLHAARTRLAQLLERQPEDRDG